MFAIRNALVSFRGKNFRKTVCDVSGASYVSAVVDSDWTSVNRAFGSAANAAPVPIRVTHPS